MLSRRTVLGALLAGTATAMPGLRTSRAAPDRGRQDFIAHAARMRGDAVAAGDQAFGAVVVKDGHVVGLGPSRVVVNTDPTAHAEMEALRDAASRLGTHDLSGAVIYTTSAPCRMCETAAYWARIERIYTGADGTSRGRPRYGC